MTTRFTISPEHPAGLQLDLFLAYRRASGKREATIAGYERIATRFICECPGLPLEPSEWTGDHVVRWVALRRRFGHGRDGGPLDENTIAYDMRQLYVFLGWLYDRDVIKRDPRKGFPVAEGQEKHRAATVEADVLRLVHVAMNARGKIAARPTSLRDAAIIRTFWSTGARVSEVAHIDFADYDRKRGTVIVRHPKSKQERELPLDPQAQAAVLEFVTSVRGFGEGSLFGLSRDGIISMLKRMALLAGVRAAPHDFRYGMARRCLLAGISQAAVQDLLGHATITMTKRYAQGAANQSAILEFRRAIG